MKDSIPGTRNALMTEGRMRAQSGFTLTELLISILILSVASTALFSILADIQHAAGYQSEVQAVLNNTQIAMQTVQRYVRQAGNDPLDCGAAGITILGPEEMRIRSDITGSAGPGNPDKGDPDGDVRDSSEDIALRYNHRNRSLEVVPAGGAAQIVAGNISGITFSYYNAAGGAAASGTEVRTVGISIFGASLQPDPRTHQYFGVQLDSRIQVSS